MIYVWFDIIKADTFVSLFVVWLSLLTRYVVCDVKASSVIIPAVNMVATDDVFDGG